MAAQLGNCLLADETFDGLLDMRVISALTPSCLKARNDHE